MGDRPVMLTGVDWPFVDEDPKNASLVLNVHQALSNGATRLWVFSSDVLDLLVITQPTKVWVLRRIRAYAPSGVLTPGWAFSFGSQLKSDPTRQLTSPAISLLFERR